MGGGGEWEVLDTTKRKLIKEYRKEISAMFIYIVKNNMK